jgi:Tol biopolymer transport system component
VSNRKNRFDLFQRASSGAGSEDLLLESNVEKYPSDWSRDGRFVVYTANDPKTKQDIWILPMNPNPKGAGGERKPFLFLQTEFNETRATFSPDGRWIAYESDESGRYEVYIRPFPGPGGKWQVSTSGGTRPRWRRDGKELFYLALDDKIMAAEIKLGSATVDVGSVWPLFQSRPFSIGGRDIYDVGDGQRFLVASPGNVESSSPVTLVVNWTGEIKKK